MSRDKRRPSERRRQKKARPKRKAAKPDFVRPRAWAQSELQGVLHWITRLAGEEGEAFPAAWRAGQLKHYKLRAKDLRKEIRAGGQRERADG